MLQGELQGLKERENHCDFFLHDKVFSLSTGVKMNSMQQRSVFRKKKNNNTVDL